MNARARYWFLSAVVLLLGLFALSTRAEADIGPKVIKAFKGQIIVSVDAVETAGSDKEVIAAFKAAKVKELKGEPNADDVTSWVFHYTAFLKTKGFKSLALEFHTGNNYVADRRLEGVDPSLTVLEGDIQITEDDGPAKNKKYTLKLVGQKGGKDVVLATTTLVMK
jgi:hypothetical protein